MTVLYIVDYGTVGGATHAFIDLVIQMKAFGVTPIVITSGRDILNVTLEKKGIQTVAAGHYTLFEPFKIHGIKWPWSLFKLWKNYYQREKNALRILDKEVNFEKIDLIHTNSARNSLGCYLSKKYGVPHIMHIREFADKDFDCVPLNPFYSRLYNEYSAAFISVSNAVKKHWTRKGIKEDKNTVIYDGVYFEDITLSDDESKKRTILKFVIVGGVCNSKGQKLAVDAICKLPKSIRKNVTLDIIGWFIPNYVETMKQQAIDAGIQNQIHFLGSRNDVHELLHNYHVGLMCSRSEGFGLVTAEYMHAGLGVIVSDSGANPELITENVEGLIFKSGDSDSLCKCMEKYYNHRNLIIVHSKYAKQKAREKFTRLLNATNILILYNKIIK